MRGKRNFGRSLSPLNYQEAFSGAALEMEREGSGWWFVAARLPAGDYRFRYLVDGRWFTDFAANGVELDKMGWNSVLVVPQVMKNIKNKFAA